MDLVMTIVMKKLSIHLRNSLYKISLIIAFENAQKVLSVKRIYTCAFYF